MHFTHQRNYLTLTQHSFLSYTSFAFAIFLLLPCHRSSTLLCYHANTSSVTKPLFISQSQRMTMPPPASASEPQSFRSASPSKSIRSLAQHLQHPGTGSRSLSPTKNRVHASPRKRDDGGGETAGGDGKDKDGKDKDKDKKKGLWNLFNAEYEI